MKYVVTLNGNKYEVEVERGQATAVYVGQSTKSVQTSQTAAPAAAPASAPAAPVASTTPAAPAAAGEDMMAPMPGTILDVRCQVGKAVKAGDVLFILEAMKMENEICASRDGTITAVSVNKGSTVETGTPLCTIS
ncbi:MAG: biotin/lipoyl-binding protein [Butyricicoccus pullicaecorum]|nr:biotin/lipoyl-binding protein [Butyricicoccus pullicaecorum]